MEVHLEKNPVGLKYIFHLLNLISVFSMVLSHRNSALDRNPASGDTNKMFIVF